MNGSGPVISKHVIDFSVNVNALGPPHGLLKALRSNIDLVLEYPDYTNHQCLQALSSFTGIQPECLTIGVGASELIFLAPRALGAQRGVVVMPTFWEYAAAIQQSLGSSRMDLLYSTVEEDFVIPLDRLADISQSSSLVFVCNPNNPTSRIVNRHDLLAVIESLPNTKFVVDETYLLFRSNYAEETLTSIAVQNENLVVVTSLSKFFAIPGLRAGFAVATPNVTRLFQNGQFTSSVGTLTQYSIPFVLREQQFVTSSRKYYHNEIGRFYQQLRKRASRIVQCIRPDANFILARITSGLTSTEIAVRLEENGVRVRDCAAFPGLGTHWIRFTVRRKAENENFITTLLSISGG